MTVCFDTFGCRLSRAEALDEEALCRAAGLDVVDDHARADIIVVRGCSVTSRAQRECEKTIEHLRRKYAGKRIVVRGCLPDAQKRGADPLAEILRSAAAAAPAVPTRTARAYLKVQDGCAGNCTFCIVPKFRGKSVSTPFPEVLAKARAFLEAGYREIVVTGCNLALYASEGRHLADLTAALAELSDAARIRIGSVEPGSAARELVAAMAEHANVCRFLHLPVQSGSGRILAAMRRPYNVRDVDELVGAALGRMPDLGLGYDLMTGFPGETDTDFMSTVELLKRHPVTNVHVFPYSARPGTSAAIMPNAVPHETRSARAHALAHLADDLRRQFARRFVGKTVEIVVEDEKHGAGWTSEYLWCKAANPGVLRRVACRKERVKMSVNAAHDGILTGIPAS